jgi:hypothetical protein
MTDNFAFMNSSSDFNQDNTQNSTGFENIIGMMNSTQSQYDQVQISKDMAGHLETIEEEPSNFTSNYKQLEGQFKGGNMRSNNVNNFGVKSNSIGDKLEYLSQEVDQLYEETQKVSEKKISDCNSNKSSMQNPFQFAGGNINRVSVAQSVNNSSNLQMKNLSLKGSATPNSAMAVLNQKGAYLQQNFASSTTTMKTKGKSSLGLNSGYYPDYRTNPGNDQNSNFLTHTDRMINNYVLALDDIKANFCAMIDREKSRFISNAEVIRDILAFENEYNHMEEEKNKALDNRMECLFKEMMSLLTEFNSFFN